MTERTQEDVSSEAPTTPFQVDNMIPLSRLLKLRHVLTFRDMDASIVANLRASGEYDPDEHAVLDAEPLSVQEHLSVLAYGAVIARHVLHPTDVDRAVRAGATWQQIAEALDRPEKDVRRDYVRWANGQRHLGENYEGDPDGVMLGMTAAEHAEALALADLPSEAPELGQAFYLTAKARANVRRVADDLGIAPGEVLERLALHVETEASDRLALAGHDDASLLDEAAVGAFRTGDLR